jgi:integrase
MASRHNSAREVCDSMVHHAMVSPVEANAGLPLRGDFERMARRRYQDPTPTRRGKWWTLRYRQDEIVNGKLERVRKEVRLALIANTSERDARRLASEHLRPLNQGLESIGAAVNFQHYVEKQFIPLVMPQYAQTTKQRYQGVLDNYLIPVFGKLCLRDLTLMTLQRYFSGMANSELSRESKDKIRDVLSTVLGSAKDYGLLVTNPAEGIRLPKEKRAKRKTKPHITPEQFDELVTMIAEPYATMVFVAIYTGLRVSELAALKWNDLGFDSITIDERFCRGDWSEPKSDASNATIGVDRCVIERIHRLKLLTVNSKAGHATRKYRIVKSDGPDDLVFQSVRKGAPLRDNNILCRFIKPAGRKLGFGFVNWRSLRTSRATWMIEAGANPKDVQGQMRHSRIQTTLDIYAQFVPESQRRAIVKTSAMVQERIAASRAAKAGLLDQQQEMFSEESAERKHSEGAKEPTASARMIN